MYDYRVAPILIQAVNEGDLAKMHHILHETEFDVEFPITDTGIRILAYVCSFN